MTQEKEPANRKGNVKIREKHACGARALKQAREEMRQLFDPATIRQSKAEVRRELLPGLRTRLLDTLGALQEARASELGDALYVDYLALASGTATQTARRWTAAGRPGLPDLVSFAMLCRAAGCDVAWMLGLSHSPAVRPRMRLAWLRDLIDDVVQFGGEQTGMRVEGDEMEPRVGAGDWVLVDTSECDWGRHGTYVVEYQGRRSLRNVETRLGEGFALTCANRKYGETVVRDESHARRLGIALVGRVTMRIDLEKV